MKSAEKISDLIGLETKSAQCEVHGSYISRCFVSKVWTKCPSCEAERVTKEKSETETRERKERLLAWQQKIGHAGIPERFRDRRLNNFAVSSDAQRKAFDFAKDYVDNFDQALAVGRGALFVGPPGTGKTHLACGIGMHIMKNQNRTVLFSTVMRAVRRVKDSWRRDSTETESQAIAAMVFPDLLILDEVGVQFGSETEKLILFDVLNERYEKRRPTLLLSNLDENEVIAYVGERIIDRMREDGGMVVPFKWESYRRNKLEACIRAS